MILYSNIVFKFKFIPTSF